MNKENLYSSLTESKNFFLIAGPCVVEDRDITFDTAIRIKSLCEKLNIPLIFKASFKKANRSSIRSFSSIGDLKALSILKEVGSTLNVPIITDIHSPEDAVLASDYADLLQIPAFLCRQTDLLIAAGNTGLIINVKKGQFLSPESMTFVAEKIKQTGNHKIILTERGTTFGYQDLVVDYRSIPIMQKTGYPVVLDCTHSLQQPNQLQGITGGQPALIETIAKAGIAVGVNGLFIETHPEPTKALSDGANMLPLHHLGDLLEKLTRIKKAISLTNDE
jgi:2-dehydro-3-deoxyphosphooctonate aldolase (KDO 8-P synthase)